MKMFFYFVLDVALAGFSAKLTKGIVDVSSRILSSISKGNSVVIGMHEAIQEYSILNAIQTMCKHVWTQPVI